MIYAVILLKQTESQEQNFRSKLSDMVDEETIEVCQYIDPPNCMISSRKSTRELRDELEFGDEERASGQGLVVLVQYINGWANSDVWEWINARK